MKKITLSLTALLATCYCFAQLNVRYNAFIYVKDEIVFVENNVNLQESNTNIYLRDEAQLIQGSQSVANSGAGKLSQLEPVKNGFYGYNAWASPVGQTTNPQNVIFTNTGNTSDGFTAWANIDFVSDTYTPNATPTQTEIADYWLWGYTAGNFYADWQHLQDISSTINPGFGFLMKGASLATGNTAKDFRGLPNSGDIVVNVVANRYTLIGNPYPSAIDARDFIYDSANKDNIKDGTLFYYYSQDTGSHNLVDYKFAYASYTINEFAPFMETKPDPALQNADITGDNPTPEGSMITNTAKRYIPISQGFFIDGASGIAPGSTLTFKNSHREYIKRSNAASTIGYRSSNLNNSTVSNKSYNTAENSSEATNSILYNSDGFSIIPDGYKRFRLHVTFINNQVNRQLIHSFNDALTSGKDYGYETAMSPVSNTDAYFFNSDRILNGIADAYDIDMKIPFVIKLATDQVINFSLVDVQNFETNQPIYLHDLKTDEYFNIANNGHQINLTSGNYENRFEITFKNNEDLLSIVEEEVNSFNIYQNNSAQALTLVNPKLLDVEKVSLYDVVGKQVYNSLDMNASNRFEISTRSLSDAVYIVKVDFTNGGSTSKKVIVSNKN